MDNGIVNGKTICNGIADNTKVKDKSVGSQPGRQRFVMSCDGMSVLLLPPTEYRASRIRDLANVSIDNISVFLRSPHCVE